VKAWLAYGSEHSMDLVMIGHFGDVADAQTALELITELTEAARIEKEAGRLVVGEPSDRYSDEILDKLMAVNIGSIGPGEIEQFLYDVHVTRDDRKVVVTTDELDVLAFIKVLLLKGARVEMLSGHDFPGSGYGRRA